MPNVRGAPVSTGDIFLWIVIPYVAITIFILGHVWRYRRDQFGWTSRSTQLLERRMLKWGSPLFHYGALAAIGGHVLGILIPQSATSAIGIDEHAYHLISAIAGTLAGAAALLGLVILIYRRASVRRVAVTTSYVDLAVYALLLFVIALGMLDTLSHNVFASGNGYNYRHTVAIWFRGVFALQDHAQLMAGRAARLPDPRALGLGDPRAVAVQPPRARLEHPLPVHRPALHPLPPPLPGRPLMHRTRGGGRARADPRARSRPPRARW